MNANTLLDAIGSVSDEYIADAQILRNGGVSSVRAPRKTVLLIAAIIIVLAGLTACAVGNDAACNWILDYLAGTAPMQADYRTGAMDAMLYNVNQTVTDNGCAVTLQAAVSDGSRAYLKFHVSLPQGMDSSEPYYYFEATPIEAAESNIENRHIGMTSYGWRYVPDDNPSDSEIDLIMDINSTVPSSLIPKNEAEWELTLNELCAYGQSPENGQFVKTICEGNWHFRYTYTSLYSQEAIELVQEPFSIWAKKSFMLGYHQFSLPIKAQVKSFRLRSLSAECTLELSKLSYKDSFFMLPVHVVMKDGRIAEAVSSGGSYDGEHEMITYFRFEEPIYIPYVDYILFPGNIRIPVNPLLE